MPWHRAIVQLIITGLWQWNISLSAITLHLLTQDPGNSLFADWLADQGLSKQLAELVMYAVAMGDEPDTMTTKEGVASLGLYLKSMGRYKISSGPFMLPFYGSGELPQVRWKVRDAGQVKDHGFMSFS